jgi:DNA-binding response OmpR family regulator
VLHRCRVLVLEDEPLVAIDLAEAVMEAGGEVMGPFSRVEDALNILAIAPPHAAILDVRLADRDVVPVARALLLVGAPVLFHSASDVPAVILNEFGPVRVLPKPAGANQVVRMLASIVGASS